LNYTKNTFLSLIDREIALAQQGKEAFLKLKMNGLTSKTMIEKLYQASQAGVKIQMIVRGVCSLVPGLKGISEHIEVISIVDRFLEHSRLYIFGNGGTHIYYISSADWMSRNLNNRVEVSCPIYQEDIQQQLWDTFHLAWEDKVKARVINQAQDNVYRSKKEGKSKIKWTTDWERSNLESIESSDDEHGTIIRIYDLRDKWSSRNIVPLKDYLSKVYNDDQMGITLDYQTDGVAITDTTENIWANPKIGENFVDSIEMDYDSSSQKLNIKLTLDEFKSSVEEIVGFSTKGKEVF